VDDLGLAIHGATEVAKRLVAKVFGVLGESSRPRLIRETAAAEADAMRLLARGKADAALITAEGKEQIKELRLQRAAARIEHEIKREQACIEGITAKALPLLTNGAKPEEIEDDWIANFFAKSRNVSNEQMQSLWARVLAGEANVPRSFSRRTVNALDDFSPADCETFTWLCDFCWDVGGRVVPLVFDYMHPIHSQSGVMLSILKQLESMGLVYLDEWREEGRGWLEPWGDSDHVEARYFDEQITLTRPDRRSKGVPLGRVLLTIVGQELVPIAGGAPRRDYFDYVVERWKHYIATTTAPPPAAE
jgi:hypothetical protein